MDLTQLLIGGGALVAILEGGRRWVWPGLRDFFSGLAGAIDNVNGRAARYDKAGRETKPAVPSLSVQLSDLRDAIADQTEQNRRITALEEQHASDSQIWAEHGQRLTALEAGHQVERSLGHVAQAKTMDAIEAVARKAERSTEDG